MSTLSHVGVYKKGIQPNSDGRRCERLPGFGDHLALQGPPHLGCVSLLGHDVVKDVKTRSVKRVYSLSEKGIGVAWNGDVIK